MSTGNRDAPTRAYRPDLDGLRAIAILSVVLYHAGLPRLTGGFTGVDIFFVLSGYLIGGQIYADLRSGTFSFAHFYQRRAKRILPALFTVIAFTLALAMILLSPAEAEDLARSGFAAALSASNILFCATTNYFTAKSSLNPMLMTWSLGVEEQFYAIVPLAMVLLFRLRRNWILPATLIVCVASFTFSWIELSRHPMFAFYLLPSRAWELGIGVALAIATTNQYPKTLPRPLAEIAGAAGLVLMIAPLFTLTASTPFPGPAALPTVFGAALMIALPQSRLNTKLLSLAPLVFIGKISYSFYLWHWPLLTLLHVVYGGDAPQLLRFAAITLSFALAVLSYRFIEQPFRRSQLAPRPLLLRYAGASVVIIILCTIVWSTRGVPRRSPALAHMESTTRTLQSDTCLAGYGVDRPGASTECIEESAAPQVLALWGDSHAAALAPGLRAVAHERGFNFLEIGKAACMPVVGATHVSPRIPLLAAECSRFNQRALQQIQSDPQVRIVILNADWAGYLYHDWQDGWLAADLASPHENPSPQSSADLFTQSLAQTIHSLQSAGKQVVVLRDIPTFDVDPLWRVRTASIPARRTLALWLGVAATSDPGSASPIRDAHIDLANSLLDKAIAASPPASLVDASSALCNNSQCLYREADSLLYADTNHLTPAGALRVANGLQAFAAGIADNRANLASPRLAKSSTGP